MPTAVISSSKLGIETVLKAPIKWSGFHSITRAHWNLVPNLDRLCEIPSIFLPSLNISPGPFPAKQTRSDRVERKNYPV